MSIPAIDETILKSKDDEESNVYVKERSEKNSVRLEDAFDQFMQKAEDQIV